MSPPTATHGSQYPVALWSREYAVNITGLAYYLAKYRYLIFPFHKVMNDIPDGSNVLDIGCGSGLFLYLLHKAGKIAHAVGIDVSPRIIEAAKKSHRNEKTSVEFHLSDSTKDWPSQHYDAVTAIDVLHHVPPNLQHDFFLALCERVKVGGRLIYKDMAAHPLRVNWGNRLHDLVLARQWIHYVAPEQILDWADKAGMVLKKRDYADYIIYGHDFFVFEKKAVA